MPKLTSIEALYCLYCIENSLDDGVIPDDIKGSIIGKLSQSSKLTPHKTATHALRWLSDNHLH